MSQHTPGPWYSYPDTDGSNVDIVVADKSGGIVCDIGGGVLDTRLANARLIAAAPDLLAACKAARAFGSQGETHEGFSVSEMLRAAIAKAEGRK